MATITEDYVSFETAKLLKEKGFNIETIKYWENEGGPTTIPSICELSEPYSNSYLGMYEYSCPTLQMAMKWLREVHHLYIQVMLDSWACGGHMGYYVVIQKTDSDFEIMLQDYVDNVFYQTYEEACEAAIKYCLERLI